MQWAADAERYRAAGRRRVSGIAVDTFRPCRRPKTVALFNGVVPALPQTLLWRARNAPIVTGAFRNPEVIHCLESRANDAGLRHAAAVPELQDTILLSVADNLAEICASDKGRSKDPALNSLLRRSAGLQLASGISWRRRHVESRRNPTDQGSRVADRGGLAPGELLRRTRPQLRRCYAVARSAAARACGLPHAEFAAQMRVPTPKQQPQSNSSPSSAAPFVPADNPTPRSILTPGDSALPGPADDAAWWPPEMTRTTRRLARLARRSGKFFLEIFSGSARLTGAFRSRGLSWLHPCDIALGELFDVGNDKVLDVLCRMISGGLVWMVHFAPPCASWSTARSHADAGLANGRMCARAVLRLLLLCHRHSVLFTVENPHTSKLWSWEPLAKFIRKCKFVIDDIFADYCQFGAPFRKRTRFITTPAYPGEASATLLLHC